MERMRVKWPTSEGAWWFQFGPHQVNCPVFAKLKGDEIIVNNLFTHPNLTKDPHWMTEKEYLYFTDSLEFIKCEPNPFT